MKEKIQSLIPTVFTWEKSKGLLSFLVIIFIAVIYFSFFSGGNDIKAQPATYATASAPKQDTSRVKRVREVKTRTKVSERRSKTSSVTNLTTGQEKLYSLLEANTKAYLEHVVGPTMMENYKFDTDGKIKSSIKNYFELSEQMIIDKFRNKIINTPLIDTIRNDTLDLRMIVYKN